MSMPHVLADLKSQQKPNRAEPKEKPPSTAAAPPHPKAHSSEVATTPGHNPTGCYKGT